MTLKRASKLKARIAKGESAREVALEVGASYQSLYRLAKGETWPDATPDGNVLIGQISRRGPSPKLPLERQHALWELGRKGTAPSRLAQAVKLSESTVRRLRLEFEWMLSHRISRLHLTSGSHAIACSRYRIPVEVAEALDANANERVLDPRLLHVAEHGLPALEKQLKAGGAT